MEEKAPEDKTLHPVSFATHATRGIIRDQTTRRKTMIFLLLLALFLLLAGSTFLAPILNPREHLIRALFFWMICGWLTLTALLLALFDLLMVRRAGREAAHNLRQSYVPGDPASRPND